MTRADSFTFTTPDLRLRARLTPWDTECFGFAVGQIDELEFRGAIADSGVLQPLFQWLDLNAIRFMSCRLSHDRLDESMLLETCGFRFVETVLHPFLILPDPRYQDTGSLCIERATSADLATLESIGAHAFVHGRIHADPRLGAAFGDRRYSNWVRSSLTHPSQRLLKIANEEGAIVAMFITETFHDKSIYWHLTAISPSFQSQGYGGRVWRAMLALHAQEGMRSVRTTITAGNVPILNLYSKLGFRFLPPEMTFHWVRGDS